MKILVVDDDAIVLDSCKRVLEAEGFEMRLASSAFEARKAMEANHFDLLLVDVKMPGRDGMWLIGETRQKWPKLPIVVMSGYPTPETVDDGARLGAPDFVAKPFTPDELLKAIQRATQKR